MTQRNNPWQETDAANQLRPELNKEVFESLSDWEFMWSFLEPIDNADDDKQELDLIKQFSAGQKAIYFFWFLDEAVTNVGFIQFYYMELDRYLPPIMEGLKLIGDNELLKLIEEAEQEYTLQYDVFALQKKCNDWNPLYQNLRNFEEFDDVYYSLRDKTIALFENYARTHLSEFGTLK